MKKLLLFIGLFLFSIVSFAQNEETDTTQYFPYDKSSYVGKIVNTKSYLLPSLKEKEEILNSELTPTLYKVNIDDDVSFYLSLKYHGWNEPRYAIITYDDLMKLKNTLNILIDKGKSITTTGDASYIESSFTTSTDVEIGFNVRSYYKNKKKGEIGYVKKWYISHNRFRRFTFYFYSHEELYGFFNIVFSMIDTLR